MKNLKRIACIAAAVVIALTPVISNYNVLAAEEIVETVETKAAPEVVEPTVVESEEVAPLVSPEEKKTAEVEAPVEEAVAKELESTDPVADAVTRPETRELAAPSTEEAVAPTTGEGPEIGEPVEPVITEMTFDRELLDILIPTIKVGMQIDLNPYVHTNLNSGDGDWLAIDQMVNFEIRSGNANAHIGMQGERGGILFCDGPGSVTVRISSKVDPTVYVETIVEIVEVPLKGISLDVTSHDLAIGETADIQLIVDPEDVTADVNVEVETTNSNVVTFEFVEVPLESMLRDGTTVWLGQIRLTAVGAGEAQINVRTPEGFSATCNVSVRAGETPVVEQVNTKQDVKPEVKTEQKQISNTPKTGDTINTTGILLVALVSGLGVLLLINRKRNARY